MAIERAELAERLAALGLSMIDRLSAEQQSWFADFVDAGEFGVALEMIADWLSEDGHPVSDVERAEAAELATALGISERVMTPLNLCPPVT